MLKAQLPAFSMAYEDRGKGIPVLFIHGYPLNRKLWEPQLGELASTARILAPDLRGHGESGPGSGPHLMDLLAEDCFAFIESIGIKKPFVVCGLSMGGYVTMAMLRHDPKKIAGVILTATRAASDSPEVKANREKAIQTALSSGSAAITETMLPKLLAPMNLADRPDLVKQAQQIMLNISIKTIVNDLIGLKERIDSSSTLLQITQPALVIHGEDDQIVPLEEARAMQKIIPNSRFVIIPQAGHLVNLEQPSLFNAAIRNFLKDLSNEKK
jgi:3-oxoadipate enol-lactonase